MTDNTRFIGAIQRMTAVVELSWTGVRLCGVALANLIVQKIIRAGILAFFIGANMPTSEEFIIAARRDGALIDAVHRALYAMWLVNGATIEIAGVTGTLHFGHEMDKLRNALRLLRGDPDSPLPTPVRRW